MSGEVAAATSSSAAAAVVESTKDVNLLAQLRHVLVTAEQESFESEGFKRKLDAERSERKQVDAQLLKSEEMCREISARLRQAELFAEQQKQHICRLQSSVEEGKRVRSGFEATTQALQGRLATLEANLEAKCASESQMREKANKVADERASALASKERLHAAMVEHKRAAEDNIAQLQKRCVALQGSAQKAQEGGKTLQARLAQVSDEWKRSEQREKDLRETNGVLKQQVANYSKSEADLRETIVALRESGESAGAQLAAERESSICLKKNCDELERARDEAQSALQAAVRKGAARESELEAQLEQVRVAKQTEKRQLEELLAQVGEDLGELKKARAQEQAQARDAQEAERAAASQRISEALEAAAARQSALEQKDRENKELIRERGELRDRVEVLGGKYKAEEQAHRQTRSQLSRASQDQDKRDKDAAKKASHLAAELGRSCKARERAQKLLAGAEREAEKQRAHATSLGAALAQERKQWQLAQTALESQVATSEQVTKEARLRCEQLETELSQLGTKSEKQAKDFQAQLDKVRGAAEAQAAAWAERRKGLLRSMEQKQKDNKELNLANAALLKELQECKALQGARDQQLGEELDNARDLQSTLKSRLEEVQAEVERRTRQAATQQQQQATMYQEQLREMALERDRDADLVKTLQERKARLEHELEKMQHSTAGQVLGLNEKQKALYRENENLRSSVAALQQQLKAAAKKEETQSAGLKEKIAHLERANRQAAENATALDSKVQALTKFKSTKEMEIVQLNQTFDEEKTRLANQAAAERQELQNAIQGVRWKSNALAKQVEQLEEEKAALQEKANSAQRENTQLKDNEANLMALYQNMARHSPGPETQSVSNQEREESHDQYDNFSKRYHTNPKKNASKKIWTDATATTSILATTHHYSKKNTRPRSAAPSKRPSLPY